MKKFVLVLALSTAFAAPAVAADFTGPRIEARVGWDRVNIEANYDDGDDAASGEGHEDGIGFGGEVGYDALVGTNFVLGGYAGVDFANTDFCTEVYGEDEGCIESGRNFSVGVRAGSVVGPNTLLYAKAGYSNGRVTVAYEDFEDIIDDFSVSENRDGWHLGAGAEMGFGANAYGKVEYVFTNYNGADFDDADVAAGIDASRHQVMVGIGFRF
jgi:outer membrane immunogenic protein